MTMLATEPASAASFTTDAECWQAVVRRDRRADEHFVYSVKTTGVYCRPSCAARLPKREHVSFHKGSRQAELAGFRACKRCRPKGLSVVQQHAVAVERACRLMEEASEPLDLATLAEAVEMSPSHFHRVFKSLTHVTPKAYAAARRAERMRHELSKRSSVTAAAYGAGFNSTGRFYAASANVLGMTPTSYRAGGKGATIQFAVGECSLGSILVAASEIGLCWIALGDDPAALVHDLEDRFAKAELIGGDREFEQLVARVVGLVERPSDGIDLPLDVQGTAFQQHVWQLLREIPCGTTTTYTELARRAGKPAAVRAVAQACAANKLAVAIPCHRVVRLDGSLSGYRWGIERKRALLARERATN